MTSRKDLVEALAFERRRLVAAFVSGTRCDREVETSRSGRAILGGVVLAALLIAGAVIAGLLSGGSGPKAVGDQRRVGHEHLESLRVDAQVAGAPGEPPTSATTSRLRLSAPPRTGCSDRGG